MTSKAKVPTNQRRQRHSQRLARLSSADRLIHQTRNREGNQMPSASFSWAILAIALWSFPFQPVSAEGTALNCPTLKCGSLDVPLPAGVGTQQDCIVCGIPTDTK